MKNEELKIKNEELNHFDMKNLIKILTVLCGICLLSVSCDKMNDIHQKYLDQSEPVYLGKADTITAYAGFEKVKLVWYSNADPKLEYTVIYWNMREDSIVKPFERSQEGHQGVQKDSVLIENLPEGSYLFEFVNKNRYGERSIATTVRGVSRGDEYRSTLAVRPATSMAYAAVNAQSSNVTIFWGNAPANALGTKLSYKKRSTGEEVALEVDNAERETILTDVGNRLGNPDDFLKISSVYALPVGECETLVQMRQEVLFTASGTRIENTYLDGAPATYTYTYANQMKIFRVNATEGEGNLVFNCNRVAELVPESLGTTFRLAVNENNTVDISGAYSVPAYYISNTKSTNSNYNPATGNFTLSYTALSPGGSYTVEETLVPKTLPPFEIDAPKPFGDLRAIIPGDNNTNLSTASYPFSRISDGITASSGGENGWIGTNAVTSPSVTIDIGAKLKLNRMILWPCIRGANPATDVYGWMNIMKLEVWGIAELDESKLSDASYWEDKADPTGTFKEDWEYLGFHEVERLDKKAAVDQAIRNRGRDGHQFLIPESAGPVRYIRLYCRENIGNANPYYFFIGELSFYGYAQ